MKKRNGFTLIEVLAVVVILALLTLVAIPVVTHSIRLSKEKVYHEQVKRILESAEKLLQKDECFLPTETNWQYTGEEKEFDYSTLTNLNVYKVPLEKLKQMGFLKNTDIKNPIKTSLNMDEYVAIYYNYPYQQYDIVYCVSEDYYKYYYEESDYNNRVKPICEKGLVPEGCNIYISPGPTPGQINTPTFGTLTTDKEWIKPYSQNWTSGKLSFTVTYDNSSYNKDSYVLRHYVYIDPHSGNTQEQILVDSNLSYCQDTVEPSACENYEISSNTNITKRGWYMILGSNLENFINTNNDEWEQIQNKTITISFNREYDYNFKALTKSFSTNEKKMSSAVFRGIDLTPPQIYNFMVNQVTNNSISLKYDLGGENAEDLLSDHRNGVRKKGSGIKINSNIEDSGVIIYYNEQNTLADLTNAANKQQKCYRSNCTINNLDPDKMYYFRLCASDWVGNKACGNIIKGKTNGVSIDINDNYIGNSYNGYYRSAKPIITFSTGNGLTYKIDDNQVTNNVVNMEEIFDSTRTINAAILTNEEIASASTTLSKIDDEKPTVSNVKVNPSTNSLEISFELNDGRSGINKNTITCQLVKDSNTISGTVTSSSEQNATCKFNNLSEETKYTYKIKVNDNVGNESNEKTGSAVTLKRQQEKIITSQKQEDCPSKDSIQNNSECILRPYYGMNNGNYEPIYVCYGGLTCFGNPQSKSGVLYTAGSGKPICATTSCSYVYSDSNGDHFVTQSGQGVTINSSGQQSTDN